jgi:hypothetical protein
MLWDIKDLHLNLYTPTRKQQHQTSWTFCDFSGLSVTEKDSGKAHFTTRTRNRTQNTNSHHDRGAKEKIA